MILSILSDSNGLDHSDKIIGIRPENIFYIKPPQGDDDQKKVGEFIGRKLEIGKRYYGVFSIEEHMDEKESKKNGTRFYFYIWDSGDPTNILYLDIIREGWLGEDWKFMVYIPGESNAQITMDYISIISFNSINKKEEPIIISP